MQEYYDIQHHSYLCVDIKSFYASCSAIELGLDPLKCMLAVVGNTERQGSVVLAASPALKERYRIKTGSRLYEIPNDENIIIVNPNMQSYIRISVEITKFFSRFVPPSDIHVYSVDESFLRVDKVMNIWGNENELALELQRCLDKEFGLFCTIGIGPNPLMSKLALDLESKKVKSGIAKWNFSDVPSKLWPVQPLSEMWGIGGRLQKRLNRMGLFKVEDIAKAELSALEKAFGVMGNQLYYHAWGIDLSDLSKSESTSNKNLSYGKGQILLRDYDKKKDVQHVILEMCEDVAKRARDAKKAGRTISLGIGYSKTELAGGFHRSKSLESPTNITKEIYEVCLQLLDEFYIDRAVRQISVRLSNITEDTFMQLDLFNERKSKQIELGYTMDKIRNKYGSTAILRAVSYTPAGTSIHRSQLIGGHKK